MLYKPTLLGDSLYGKLVSLVRQKMRETIKQVCLFVGKMLIEYCCYLSQV